MTLLAPLAALLLLLAAPAWAGTDETPGGSAARGFPIALVVLAVAVVALALVWRAVSKRKGQG